MLRGGVARLASWILSAFPPGFAQARFAAPVYRRLLASSDPLSVRARLRGGARVELDLRDRIQGITFLIRDYDPGLIRFLASRLRPGGVFVDVGAHVGLVSFAVAARRRNARVRVHAFEPDPVNAAAFRRNLALNPDLGVTLHQFAVGARRERAVLRRAGASERACGQLVDSSEAGSGDEVDVDVVSLASYLDQQGIDEVDVLKVDVEGHEPQVLEGAEELLRRRRARWVVLEINDERLAARGLTREQLYDEVCRHGYRVAEIPSVGLRRLFPRSESGPNEDVAFALADGPA